MVLTFVTACGEEEPTPVPPAPKSTIMLDQTALEVAFIGGEYKVDYYIDNRVENVELEVSSDVDWVSDFVVSHTFVGFTVAANEGDARQAQITLSYNGEVATIDIAQAAYDPSKPFTITVESLSTTKCITRVDALDDSMNYIMYFSEVSYFTNGNITTVEELIEDDYRAFTNGAAFDGITVEEYLLKYNALFKGTTRAEWSSLRPGAKSVLYVYGVEFTEDGADYEVITDVVYEIIIQQTVQPYDVAFDVDISVDGPDVRFDIEVNGWDDHYVVEVVPAGHTLYVAEGAEVDDAYCTGLSSWWWETCNAYQMYYGMTNDDIVAEYCMRGNGSKEMELTASTDYCALIFAVEEVEGVLQVVSRPEVKRFATMGVEPSDMVIRFELDGVYSRVADVRILPSADDQKYFFILIPSSDVSATDDDAIIRELLDNYAMFGYIFKGEQNLHIATLKPKLAYSMFVFGLHGSVVTTPLFRCDFTTEAAAEGVVNVEEVKIGGPYNPGDLAAAMPEQYGSYAMYDGECYVISMQTITDAPTRDKFYLCWDCETYDYFSYMMPSIVLEDLIAYYCDPIGVTICPFDMEHLVCGIAMDERGNLGEMWVSERFSYTADDYVPVDELVEQLRTQAATMSTPKSLVYSR